VTQIGVDFDALHAAASQHGTAAESFSQGSGQATGMPGAAAPLGAAGLLERVTGALGGALGKVASELDQISSHLSGTAAAYEETERMLSAWFVPGGSS
jgi:uncharacterized protein YukE